MAKTITLPQDLLFQIRALTDGGTEELLDDGQLIPLLSEEFDAICLRPPVDLMERVYAYSASHRSYHSELLNEDIPVFLN